MAGNRTLEEQLALLNTDPCLQPLGPLEEQPVILNVEPSLQPLTYFLTRQSVPSSLHQGFTVKTHNLRSLYNTDPYRHLLSLYLSE